MKVPGFDHPHGDRRAAIVHELSVVRNLVFLTGAGVSTDSGIPDFRTMDQEWPFSVSRQEATSLAYFKKDPRKFWVAFRHMFDLKVGVKPSAFHEAIANLEAKGKNVTIVTQNIDGLHTAAGSSRVLEVHGSLREARCARGSCLNRVPLRSLDGDPLPRCGVCNALLRPDVVLFGELPHHLEVAQEECIEASVLIVAGTSLDVGPVNTFPQLREWRHAELPTIWFNRFMAPHGYNFSHSWPRPLSQAAELLNEISV